MKHLPHSDDQTNSSLMRSVSTPSGFAPAYAWVASWAASAQPLWGDDFLFPTNVPGRLHNQTVRQMARISLGGKRLRIVLSNVHGKAPVCIGRAAVARSADDIRAITFSGEFAGTMLPGATLISDPIDMETEALSRLTISLFLPQPTPLTTFHWDGRQTGWIVSGDQTHAPELDMIPPSMSTTARPLLAGIHVERIGTPRSVVVIGDSITDGATASLDKDTRWPDFLATRLAPYGAAVVNAGISGARLLSDGMGANALARLERDVLTQPGVQAAIVALGINDIAWPGTAFARNASLPIFASLTAGYRQLITQLHAHGVRVIGATLAPFEGALPDSPLDDYFQPEKDALRHQINDWIRHSHAFDAVLRDPVHPARMLAAYDSGDHLHPGDEGLRAMANAVDLRALLPELMPEAVNPPSRLTP